MATITQLKQRVENALARHAKVNRKRDELRGQLEARKKELVEIGEEIQAAGFDPRQLKQQRDQAHEDLQELLVSFEQDMQEVESALEEFEKEKS
jgi:chromosome segregation ATPase